MTDVNDEDDLFGPGEPGDEGAGDGSDVKQEVAQDQPKDGGEELGAEGNEQEDPAKGEADQGKSDKGAEGDKDPDADPKDDKDAGDKPKDDKDDKYVPKKALESERRRRRELSQRLKSLEEREAERERAAAAASAPRPGQPGYEEYVQQQTIVTAVNERLNRSEYDARKEHGDELVDEMMAWAQDRFKSNPEWAKSVLGHPHPYDHAMRDFKKEQEAQAAVQDHGDPEYAKFLAWQKSQGQGGTPTPAGSLSSAPANQPPPVQKAPPPTSLAQRQSAGAGTPPAAANKDAFDQEFG